MKFAAQAAKTARAILREHNGDVKAAINYCRNQGMDGPLEILRRWRDKATPAPKRYELNATSLPWDVAR